MKKLPWKPRHLPVSGPEWTRHIGNRVFVPAPVTAQPALFVAGG